MRKECITLLAALLAAAPLAAQAPNIPRLAAVADSIAAVQLAEGIVPGMSVAIAQNGEIIFERSYGMSDIEMSVAASAATVWRGRSLTKQYTAAMIMRLMEEGRLSLDDPLSKHLPEYPLQGNRVTLRHLLTHTSGLTAQSSSIDLETALSGGNRQWFKLDLSFAEMVARFGGLPFEFRPGERYRYNNLGYYLLSEIIARVTGTTYADHVEAGFLRPLGLSETWFCDDHRVIPNRASGYEHYRGALWNAPYVASVSIGVGAGALCSTARDAVKWTHLLHSGNVVSAESLRQMTTHTVLANGDSVPYGLGLRLGVLEDFRRVYHGGTRPGFGANLSHYPGFGLTIVVLNNSGSGHPRAEAMERSLARAALGLERQVIPLATADWPRYAGEYSLRMGERTMDVRVFAESGELRAQAAGQGTIRLMHHGNHTFVARSNPDIRLVFTVEGGRAERLTLHQAGRTAEGERKR